MSIYYNILQENNKNTRLFKHFSFSEKELEEFHGNFKDFDYIITKELFKTAKKIQKKYEKIEGKRGIVIPFYDKDYNVFVLDILTKEDLEGKKFHRILIKPVIFLSSLVIKEMEEEIKKFAFKYNYPAGVIDSYTIFIVGQYRLDNNPIKNTFFHGKKQSNVMFCYIITKSPFKALERIFTILIEFYRSRLKKFIDSFRLGKYFEKTDNIRTFPKFLIGVGYKINSFIGNFIKRLVVIIDLLESLVVLLRIGKNIKKLKKEASKFLNKIRFYILRKTKTKNISKNTLLYGFKEIQNENGKENHEINEKDIKKFKFIPILIYYNELLFYNYLNNFNKIE